MNGGHPASIVVVGLLLGHTQNPSFNSRWHFILSSNTPLITTWTYLLHYLD
jgi:hypothetical protein